MEPDGAVSLVTLTPQTPLMKALKPVLPERGLLVTKSEQGWFVNRVSTGGPRLGGAPLLAERIGTSGPGGARPPACLTHGTAILSSWDRQAWELNNAEADPVFASPEPRERALALAEKRATIWTSS